MSSHVFIIENNPLLIKLYRSMLHPLHYTVQHATNVNDALQALNNLKADLIILDERLVKQACQDAGNQLEQRIRSSSTPLIATTFRRACDFEQTPDPSQFTTVVSKPFQIDFFTDLVRRTITSRPTSSVGI